MPDEFVTLCINKDYLTLPLSFKNCTLCFVCMPKTKRQIYLTDH